MEKSFKTIEKNIETEITEKKSKFIANLFYVENIEKVEKYLNEVYKKYYDAKHHCFAYRIIKNGTVLEKSSDDGEPSGTAGSPILQLLTNKELMNVLVIVTRYFGGTLLGTGGLVRAYSGVTSNAIEQTKIISKIEGEVLKISMPYQNLEYFKYYCHKNNIKIIKIEYEELPICIIETTLDEKDKILYEMKEKQFNIRKVEVLKKQYISKNI